MNNDVTSSHVPFAHDVDEHFVGAVAQMEPGSAHPGAEVGAASAGSAGSPAARSSAEPLDPQFLRMLFRAQAMSRHVDFAARWMQSQGRGYYTIGSSGHEANALVALAARDSDPGLLHYRSGGFYMARAARRGHENAARDILRGVAAAATEPMSGGRHKVFGHAQLDIIPQTSTIASHLPRSMGLAFAIDRAAKLGVETLWPADAIVISSFGDASVNHSTTQGALNAAALTASRGLPVPVLFVCEDNGLGISVPTPKGWIENSLSSRAGLEYFSADGVAGADGSGAGGAEIDGAGADGSAVADVAAMFATCRAAVDYVRIKRRPAVLRVPTVRLMGHAGSDVEAAYRTQAEIRADYAHDPLLATAAALIDSGELDADGVLDLYEECRAEVASIAQEALTEPALTSGNEVASAVVPTKRVHRGTADAGTTGTGGGGAASAREGAPATSLTAVGSANGAGLTVAQGINRALAGILAERREAVVFGEDVGRKGGVYGVTRGLQKSFGAARVFDTILDEQSILGLALGAGVSGLLPIPEIEYLAYLHNAEDQLRGEAATLPFFSDGQYTNPMVVRIPGYAYQKGFGGHFHNDNSVAVLRDIPGLIIASPSRADDAAAMLRTCVDEAATHGRISAFVEPIALYHTKDLFEAGDGEWTFEVASGEDASAELGRARTYGDGTDLTILTFGNGVPMSLRAARRLSERGIGVRILDLRWLAPLPVADIVAAASASSAVLIVDETRRTGGIAEALCALMVDEGIVRPTRIVAGMDSFIPLGDASRLVLVDEDGIEEAAAGLCQR